MWMLEATSLFEESLRPLYSKTYLEHLQQPPNAPRAKNYFAARPSPDLARRAALAPAAVLKCSARVAPVARQNAAQATRTNNICIPKQKQKDQNKQK